MKKQQHDRRGQILTSEVVLLLFIVIAAIATMSVMFQRSLQAKQRDTSRYMVDMATAACSQTTTVDGVDCLGATGLRANEKVQYQYEPYYTQSQAQVQRGAADKRVIDELGQMKKYSASQTDSDALGRQLPPREAK